jgi:hypothetical protein
VAHRCVTQHVSHVNDRVDYHSVLMDAVDYCHRNKVAHMCVTQHADSSTLSVLARVCTAVALLQCLPKTHGTDSHMLATQPVLVIRQDLSCWR